MNKADYIAAHPEFPWLAVDDTAAVERLLADRGCLAPGERVTTCRTAGEGNMNLTLRVVTDCRSVIVKQARPWVEKYDHLAAPWDRGEVEQRFYARIDSVEGVASRMPRMLYADSDARTMLLEDLGEAGDFSSLYAGGVLSGAELESLAAYVAALHSATRGTDLTGFENRAMRELNHLHIFEFPLAEDNGLDLDSFEQGLSKSTASLRDDAAYRSIVAETGLRYLADGDTLVHGDYFPGSWLRTDDGVRVIDPEFCFAGEPEFDLGVAIGHFALAGLPVEAASQLLTHYVNLAEGMMIDAEWLARYAACEVMRRLIGVAQLPLPPTEGRRTELLQHSRRAAMEGRWSKLWNL